MELNPLLEKYIEENSEHENSILRQIRKETHLKTTQPHMLSGVLQGRILSMISKMINPKFILEIGTFTGYSTLCLAEGLSSSGKILTLDKNLETACIPKKYFEISEFKDQIEFKIENALIYIPKIIETIDLVFLDADKENYSNYLDLVKPKLKKGGIILADNILWKGKVIDHKGDKKTEIIKDFNKKVHSDDELEVVILPIRDGLSIIRKK
ncbi:O-methyltransferase [Apibacter muscae]|uniref:O-methyltransferase n=1 Tax=Apibacter muscae TaxID=2509004 RepID=A0A563DGH0_9FLAO|nr:O-methyltransferase [Apibacter muscae]TWP29295.1 O-methyltransferase [Apibacter muscae]